MEWIRVKDDFPKQDGMFLVYEPNVGVYIAYVTKMNGDYFWWSNSLTPRNGITHWMPLSKPPKEDD